MNIANLSSSQFSKIVKLLRKKEALLKKVRSIEGELSGLGIGDHLPKKRGRKPLQEKGQARQRRFRKQGSLREAILTELKAAGKAGMRIKEIAHKLAIQRQRLDTWFYQNSKKVAGLVKTSEGKFIRYTYTPTAN
ncbi:MAG: hypothetical protein V1746_01070 [bacterium]